MLTKKEIKVVGLCALVGGLVGLAAAYVIPPSFEAKGSVVVLRKSVEISESTQEDDKNRWVWVRDGLALAQQLMSDDFLLPYLNSRPAMKSRLYSKVPESVGLHLLGARLRKYVKVDFTGGDEYSFVISVRDRDANEALALALALMERINQLASKDVSRRYEAALDQMEQKFAKEKSQNDGIIKNRLQELKVNTWLTQAQENDRVKVLLQPYLPQRPCWPLSKIWFLAGLLLGSVVGYVGVRCKCRNSSSA